MRETLLDFFDDFSRASATFLVYDDGYRTREYTYAQVRAGAFAFAHRLRGAGVGRGEKLLLWGENRPEWIVAFWGALLEGVVVVPIDYRASFDLVARVERIVSARAIVVGTEVRVREGEIAVPVWKMEGLLKEDEGKRKKEKGEREEGKGKREKENGKRNAKKDDVAEIIFTSGATADPKGVVLTHRNILANIVPVEREVLKYRKYGRPFFPIRFLNLLPLSHMFGQAMATFVPPMLPGAVVFMRGYNPAEIVRQIRTRRVSVLVCVPKVLDVLREHIVRLAPEAADPPAPGAGVLRRWWRYRRVHRALGLKFWSFVVGAAPLDPELEQFWRRLGFVVIQGYGLTETAPIVTLNHPFRTRAGSVGTPIAGVEVKIASDGEILVRGENVTTGYYKADAESRAAFEGGWFHTGDVGEVDEGGRLFVRGRKKEMIVTPEGLNVFPDDVERVLDGIAGVKDSAVVGIVRGGEERVHAVLRLEPGADADDIVRVANTQLEDHQKIRGISVWPGGELPRTEGTRKLKRRALKQWIESGGTPARAATPDASRSVEAAIARFAGDRTITRETTIDELGLSSLERVELLMDLEERFQTTIDEGSFAQARRVADLYALLDEKGSDSFAGPGPAYRLGPVGQKGSEPLETVRFPAWNRSAPARLVRRVSLPTWILPLARVFAWIRVRGREHIANLEGPVIFASNHQSHFDTPVILAALPPRLRYRVAPAMAKEFFRAHFFPAQHTRRQRFTSGLNYYLATLFFNAFPLPQREAGARQTLRYAGELVSDGFSILIFPEGRRAPEGGIAPFQPGVGMLGARLRVPVVPVRLEGVDRILHPSWRMARPGRVEVRFGPPLRLQGDDYAALAREVEEAVRML